MTVAPAQVRRLGLAAALVAVGLLIELVTLFFPHPLAFSAFLFPGALLVLAGIVLYLWSLLRVTG
jgi:hypothetical protein